MKKTEDEKVNPTRIERMTLRRQAETGISRSTTELRVLLDSCKSCLT